MAAREYTGQHIVVTFDAKRCVHSAVCLKTLPGVFDLNTKPWVRADEASADEVAHAVARCPSGALQFRRLDGGPAEVVPSVPRLVALKNGPLLLNGTVEAADHLGQPIELGPRAALCRCGQSANKPFCDGTHRKNGFRSEP